MMAVSYPTDLPDPAGLMSTHVYGAEIELEGDRRKAPYVEATWGNSAEPLMDLALTGRNWASVEKNLLAGTEDRQRGFTAFYREIRRQLTRKSMLEIQQRQWQEAINRAGE